MHLNTNIIILQLSEYTFIKIIGIQIYYTFCVSQIKNFGVSVVNSHQNIGETPRRVLRRTALFSEREILAEGKTIYMVLIFSKLGKICNTDTKHLTYTNM